MTTRILERAQWADYFERLSRRMMAAKAEIRVNGLDVGSQVEAEQLRVDSLSYDEQADTLTVSSDNWHHRIPQPRRIAVDERGGQLAAVEVRDAEGRTQILQFTRLLTLPPPQ